MKTRVFFLLPFLFVFATAIFAQETAPETATPAQPGVMPGMGMTPEMAMPRMNPTQLLRMRNQLTFELQEIQRIVGLVNPADTPLVEMHKQRQKEVVDQLKDVETQLKAQGIPVEDAPATPPGLPTPPPAQDPTLVPGGMPQPPADPNLLIQRLPGSENAMQGMPVGMTPTMPPGFGMYNPMMPPRKIPAPTNPMTPQGIQAGMIPDATPPTGFDQDQAWGNSPWVPQPSKELTEMKQTVESLRKEIGELKATVKALETQIQLLNRNILLSQPAAPATP